MAGNLLIELTRTPYLDRVPAEVREERQMVKVDHFQIGDESLGNT
jgi:hypothetical protein